MRYSEQEVNSEILDQPEFFGEPRKVFLCSTPRSGSYMLCRYMINVGLGVPHEYFNPINMRQIAPRLGLGEGVAQLKWRKRSPRDYLPFGKAARATEMDFLGKYLAVLVPRRCQGDTFAAKIHFDQYLKILDNSVGWKLLDGGLFIHLYRDDLLGQAISMHFANLTGRWSIDDAVTTRPAPRPDFFNVAAIDRTLEELAEQDRGWRAFFGRNGLRVMSISYERFCQDPSGHVEAIARYLGIDPGTLRHSYSEAGSPPEGDPNLPSKNAVARHYLASSRKINQSQPAKPLSNRDAAPVGQHVTAK